MKSRPQALRQALQEQTRAAYREAILDAAERVFLTDGFQSAKMVDVAEATGVSVGTLYNYYDSKEAVFMALVERHRTRYFDMLCASFATEDPIQQLRELVGRSLDFVEKNGALFAIYLRSTTPILDGAMRCTPAINPAEDNDRYLTLLGQLLTRGIEAGKLRNDIPIDELVWTLHSLMHAAVLEWVGSTERRSLVTRGQFLVQLFLEGASQK
ncbi:MAG: TetR/AcrR family transcriptional regulator [Polyangiaceae bacterium]